MYTKGQNMTNKQYNEYVEKRAKRSPCLLNCFKAFLVGGSICLLAEIYNQFYQYIGINASDSSLLSSLSLIVLSCILTGIGVFDKIAKFGGGGALVPITGFANAMSSPSIESKSEGFITGLGSKMFTIAGPVIVYGSLASILYGVFYYLNIM
jgi:stage V sporulation protein AC